MLIYSIDGLVSSGWLYREVSHFCLSPYLELSPNSPCIHDPNKSCLGNFSSLRKYEGACLCLFSKYPRLPGSVLKMCVPSHLWVTATPGPLTVCGPVLLAWAVHCFWACIARVGRSLFLSLYCSRGPFTVSEPVLLTWAVHCFWACIARVGRSRSTSLKYSFSATQSSLKAKQNYISTNL